MASHSAARSSLTARPTPTNSTLHPPGCTSMPAVSACASGRAGARAGPRSAASSARARSELPPPVLHSTPTRSHVQPSAALEPSGARARESTPLTRSSERPLGVCPMASTRSAQRCMLCAKTIPSSTRHADSNAPSCPPPTPSPRDTLIGPAVGGAHASAPSRRNSADLAWPSARSCAQPIEPASSTIRVCAPSSACSMSAIARARDSGERARAIATASAANSCSLTRCTTARGEGESSRGPAGPSTDSAAAASTSASTPASTNAPRSSASVSSSCAKTAGSASPLVSTRTCVGGGSCALAPSASATPAGGTSSRRTASKCWRRSPVGEQQTQPLPKSNISPRSMTSRPPPRADPAAESTGCVSSPNSRASRCVITAGTLPGAKPSSSARSRLSRVVFPLPGAPVMMSTGRRAIARRRACRRSAV
mmetsp:Transcript_21299/g.66081  ORF Transcript_21299/g.66081 Transcript_21299/m.66081 type:complete len:425 (+) Transcript_21299:708-1982(+)